MPFDKDFWGKLATKHKLSQEQIDAISGNEGLLHEFDEMFLRRDDAKTLIASTQAEKAAAETARTEALAKYRENLEWYGKKQADLMLVDQYRSRYGELTDDKGGDRDRKLIDSPANMTPEKVQELIRGGQREVYNITKEMLKIDREHQKRFGEPLPLEELEAVALKPENNGRSLRDVYSDWAAPKIEERSKADVEARIAKAKEDSYKEGLAKGRMREPSTVSDGEFNPFYDRKPVKPEDRPDDVTLKQHFVETFDKNMEAENAAAST